MARSKSVIQVAITGEASGLKRATGVATGALGGLAVGIARVTAAAGSLAVGIGAIGVRAFASFDEEMTKATAIMGDLSDTMRNDLADAAREVARTTTKSHEEAAASIYDLASAGLDANQIIGALPQVAAFAEAGMMEMSTAAEQMAGAFFAMRMETGTAQGDMEQFTRITDVLTQANNLGAGSVEDFSAALTNKAGAAAALAGKDIEEVTAVLIAFAKQNIIGQEAGERTSILFRDIARAAALNADEFARLGVEVFDANGNYKNMADVIAEFEGLFTGMSDAQKASTLDQLGLTRSVADNIKALAGSSEMIREYETNLRGASGATEDIAEKQRNTFNAQLQILQNNLRDTAIELGSVLVPKILELFEAFGGQEGIQNFGENLAAGIERLDEALTPVVQFIKDEVIPAIQENMPAAMAAAQPVVDTLRAVFETVGRIIRDTVIPAVSDLFTRFEEMKPAVDGLALFFREILLPAIEAVIGFIFERVLPVFLDFLQPALQIAGVFLGELAERWDALKPAIQPLIDLFMDIWTQLETVGKVLRVVGEALLGFTGKYILSLLDGLIKIIETVRKVIDWFRKLTGAANEASGAANNAGNFERNLDQRAKGGPVSSNVPYWVGEQGPEVFVPRTAGYVLPNDFMSAVGTPVEFGSGGGVSVEPGAVVVNLTMAGGDSADVARKVRREVDAALKQLARELAVS